MKITNFILGTDWWTDTDDIVAMRIMAKKHNEGSINLCAVVLNACMEYSAPSLSAFLASEGLYDMPIGLDKNATDFGMRDVMYQPDMAKNPHYMTNEACEDAVSLYRRILAESKEKIDIIEIGYPQVLANLLKSGSDEYSSLDGKELVSRKVNKLWMMAGNWESDTGCENNFTRNQRSRQGGSYVCDNWPTPISFLGWETGNTVITGGKITDDGDMLKIAMDKMGFAHGRSSWDPMLCLMACIGNEADAGYDTVQGVASVNPETGENYFKKTEAGKHCYVVKIYDDSFYADMIDDII